MILISLINLRFHNRLYPPKLIWNCFWALKAHSEKLSTLKNVFGSESSFNVALDGKSFNFPELQWSNFSWSISEIQDFIEWIILHPTSCFNWILDHISSGKLIHALIGSPKLTENRSEYWEFFGTLNAHFPHCSIFSIVFHHKTDSLFMTSIN